MAVHSSGFAKGLTPVTYATDFTFKVGEQFSEDVSFGSASSFKLNDRVDLPEGVEFDENGTLSGKIDHVGLYRIDIIGNKEARKIVINIVPDEAEYDENLMETAGDSDGGKKDDKPAKKGCFGDMTSVGALAGIIALAGIATIVLAADKKRRA